MKVKATYLLATCFMLLFAGLGLATTSFAQPSIGVVWDVPNDEAEIRKQLQAFSELGVTYIEVSHPINETVLSLLEDTDLAIIVRARVSLLTLNDLTRQQTPLLQQYLEITDRYRSHFNVTAIGLLTNSHTAHPDFEQVFNPVLDSLNVHSNKTFYFYFQGAWFNFDAPGQPFGIYIDDHQFQPADLVTFDARFQQDVAMDSKVIYFFNSSWLLEATEKYGELTESLINYKNSGIWTLALPETDIQSIEANWIVLLLLLLWGALALQLKYLPYIRPMILRYFLAHRFFVDDILHYRERTATGGLLIMAKHAVFGGTVFYLCSTVMISEAGLQAFFHQLPLLAITGVNYISLFVIGMVTILITQIIALFWLHLPAKNLEHISQTINLYAGIFYLDYILITIMVTLYVAGIGHSAILVLGFMYLFFWFSAFNIAAADASRNMGAQKLIYLLLTIGLHITLFVAAIVLVLINTEIIQILDLAISL